MANVSDAATGYDASRGRFNYQHITNYLRIGQYPDGFEKTDKLALRKRAKFFILQEAHLYYVGGKATGTPRLVDDKKRQKKIISSIHDESHLGINRTNELVCIKYYWPGLTKDVTSYVMTCDRCQHNNKRLMKAAGSLHPVPVKSKFWSQAGMDLIGPLPETSRGNKYIITLTDYFSKWAEAAPLPDKTAAGVARFMYSCMCRHGCPEIVITDQGREFVNELTKQLYQITNTQHRLTSPYHPQTNGLTERFNQTLSRCLSKCCEDHTRWDDYIDTILMGYRASSQASTKHSPFFILHQEQMRLPIDIEMTPTLVNDGNLKPEDFDKTLQALLVKRDEVFGKVEENISSAQQKQKDTYDRKHLPEELTVGTEVLKENTAQKERKGGKLEDAFIGPYFIHKSFGKGMYQLRNENGTVLKRKINIARLKTYKKRKIDGDEKNEEIHSQSGENTTGNEESKKIKRNEIKTERVGKKSKGLSSCEKTFNKEMREKLRSGQWLDDNHIRLAQQLLQDEFSHIDGFQSSLLSQNDGFFPVQGEAIQIHHIDNNHWMTSSSLGDLSPSLTHQLALLYRALSESDESDDVAAILCVNVPPVQQQVGLNDCGLFAIAFAMHLALGHSVEELEFDQAQMRDHLTKCFTQKRMLPFPTLKQLSLRSNHFPAREIELYCVCLMPDTYGDMVECDNCYDWFHLKCIGLSSFPSTTDVWHCRNCVHASKGSA